MDSVDWSDRHEVSRLVKHYLTLREAASNGDIECAQLSVIDEVNSIMRNLDSYNAQVFNYFYCEESSFVASMLEQEALEKNQ